MGGYMILEEDRLVLHDLKGVNLKVDFFLCTREEYLLETKCISYSVYYNSVNVQVDQVTLSEKLLDLDFYYTTQRLYIDDHTLSGEVISFTFEQSNLGLIAYCIMLLGKDY